MSILNMAQWKLALVFILYFTVVFTQKYTKLVIDGAGVVYADNDYFSSVELKVFQWGKMVYSMDGDFNLSTDIPKSVSVKITMCKLRDDDCELALEIYEKNICKFIRDEIQDWFIPEYLSKQNFIEKCPIKKNNYSFKKFMPVDYDYTALDILFGRVRADLFFNYKGKTLLHLYWQTNMLTNI